MLALWLLLSLQDLGAVMDRADRLFEESRALYEKAKADGSARTFVEAAFKLEEARAKYAAVQEVGEGAPQKAAIEKLRALNQLAKLINDGKKASSGGAPETPTAKPPDPKPDAPPAPEIPAMIAPAMNKPARMPVPEFAAQRESEKAVRDLYKDDYARKAPADRRTLARKLLGLTQKSPAGSVERWVLFREAQDMATQGADPDYVAVVVDAASKDFEIDAVVMKTAAMAGVSKSAKLPAELFFLSEQYQQLAEQSLTADEFDSGEKAAAAALAVARRTNDPVLIKRMEQYSKEFGDLKARFESQKKARETLLRDPSDPPANLEFGQYWCLVRGDFVVGLPFLVKGSDPVLKAAAEKDLNPSGDAMAKGDAWWELSEREKTPARKGRMLGRMAFWYDVALPDSSGVNRAMIEKRMANVDPSAAGNAVVNLLKLVDLGQDKVLGDWAWEGDGLLACVKKLPLSRVQIPYAPPAEYDLIAVIERKEGIEGVSLGVFISGVPIEVTIDGWGGTVSGLSNIDGKGADRNESGFRAHVLLQDRPALVSCSIRKDFISVSLDGKKLFAWKGNVKRINLIPELKPNNPRALFVHSFDSRSIWSRVELIPVSGRGQKLR